MTKATGPHLHFYQAGQLHTVLGATTRHTFFRNQDRPLAEQHGAAPGTVHLLSTDTQGSAVQAQDAQETHRLSYAPFGHDPDRNTLSPLTGFNGQVRDRQTGWYLLGSGYRAFSSARMRFNSPDSYSPFGSGGINAYMYCEGDPVNLIDPTGHSPWRPRANLIKNAGNHRLKSVVGNRIAQPRQSSVSPRRLTALAGVETPSSNRKDLQADPLELTTPIVQYRFKVIEGIKKGHNTHNKDFYTPKYINYKEFRRNAARLIIEKEKEVGRGSALKYFNENWPQENNVMEKIKWEIKSIRENPIKN